MALLPKSTDVKLIYNFLGSRVRKYLYFDLVIGFLWFGVESSFIFVLQSFLVSIGLLDRSLALLPSWMPTDFQSNIVLLLAFGVIRTSLTMAKNYLTIFACQAFIREKREALLAQGLLGKYEVSHQEIISAFSETVAHAGNFVVHLNNLIHSVVVTGLFTAICFRVAPYESLAGIALLFIFLVPLRKIAKHVNSHGDSMHKSWKISHGILLSGLRNIFFLRLHGMLQNESQRGAKSLRDYEHSYHQYAVTSSLVGGLPQLIGIIVLCCIAWCGREYFGTTASTLLTFFYLFIRFAQSASQTNNYLSYLKLTHHGFSKLVELFEKLGKVDTTPPVRHSRLSEVSFKAIDLKCGYPNKAPLFENLSFELQRAQLLVVKGPSGVGKSTLLRTILGETHPLGGTLLFNGDPQINPASLSRSIGYVGPEPFIIYGSVRENLLFGNELDTVSEGELWQALTDVGLRTEISKMPKQLDEILLDETQLSSGQKQRLSLARALLRKPSFLVLDEATANIDAETEEKIINVIRVLKPSMTTFVISHKSSFDFLADEIITLGKTT